jgi:uncharacterized membrane protein YhaH (DUF805 family)
MNYFFKTPQNYTTITGQVKRSEFWYFFLFILITSFSIGFIGDLVGYEYLGVIYSLAILIPAIAFGDRRGKID